MKSAGRLAVYVGIALIAIGFLVGFGAMFMGEQRQAVIWLNIIPLGFVVLLAGTVASQLAHSKDNN